MDFFDELLERPSQPGLTTGLMRGVVKENWDEKNKGKVKVELYLGEKGKRVSDWIPVAMPYTAAKAGMYFLPEVGTEVIVGFELGNPDCPVVIGSLWNNNTPLPEATPDKENKTKRIQTKGGHDLLFDETKDKAVLQLKTPGELTIRMEDENQKIAIQNKKGDTFVTVNGKEGTVTLDAKKSLELKVGGKSLITLGKDKVTISAGTVSISGKQSLKVESQSANIKANMLTVKGDGTLKLESGGIAELKGTMVKIN